MQRTLDCRQSDQAETSRVTGMITMAVSKALEVAGVLKPGSLL